jgi:hypothetical protein
MKLLTSQKDEIFEIINDYEGFTPSQFKIRDLESIKAVNIVFSNASYFFRVYLHSESKIYLHFSPGHERFEEHAETLNWEQSTNWFMNWLDYLKREITTPDYWGNLKNQISGITFLNQIDNEKFTYSEYEDLKVKMDIIISKLDSIPLIQDQQTEIINHLNKLSEQAKELGKFDWRNLFVGTMIAIFIQLGVSQDNISVLWEIIKSTFSNYFLE